MSWIKENKFVATLAGVTAVISGGILFFGISQSSLYEEKLGTYEEVKSSLLKVSKAKPYPDEQGLTAREEGIAEYKALINSVDEGLQSYKPAELKALTPEGFSDARVAMEKELRAAFTESKTELPGRCSFGFERYAKVQANAAATKKLNYQLMAVKSLMLDLAAQKPSKLTNIKRYNLPVEDVAKKPAARSGRNSGRESKSKGESSEVYQLLPMELGFVGTEASVRQFLKNMVNSKEYFYTINVLRIQNEKQRSVGEQDVSFPTAKKASAATAGFADFFNDDDSEGEDKPASEAEGAEMASEPGAKILNQVLGNELLHVYLNFDVVLMRERASNRK